MQRRLLTSGNIFKRTDGRWSGVVWYSDEQGEKKRKSFCGSTKPEVKEKITAYIADFKQKLVEMDAVPMIKRSNGDHRALLREEGRRPIGRHHRRVRAITHIKIISPSRQNAGPERTSLMLK